MGRPERPLERDGSPARELAHWLRDLRNQSGMTYGQLGKRTGFSTSTLQEALSGRRLPTLQVTLAIVQACDGDVAAWRSYWAQIRRALDPDAPSVVSVVPSWALTTETDLDQVTSKEAPNDGLRVEEGHSTAITPRFRWSRWAWLIAGGLVLTTAVSVSVAMIITIRASRSNLEFPSPYDHPTVPAVGSVVRTHTEQEFNPNGAPTFLYLDGSGAGIPVAYGQYVQVSCRVHSTIVKSTMPDGYWYRLASMPWGDHYYAVANTFGNGDKIGGPYTHNTDWRVPNCK